MKSIILVRHGQSQEQSGESADGRNPGLSELGVWQSLQLKKRLAGLTFDLALVSPLDRAYRTFELVAPEVGEAEFDSRLIEVDYVENWYHSMVGYSPDRERRFRNADSWQVPVEERARALVRELVSIEHQRILLFGHQGIFKQLIGAWLGIPGDALMYGLRLANTSLTGLCFSDWGEKSIHFINDVSHLNEREGGLKSDLSLVAERLRPWRADRVVAPEIKRVQAGG